MSFKRIYELTIGKPLIVRDASSENVGTNLAKYLYSQSGVLADGSFVEKVDLDEYVTQANANGRILTNNHITFNISKSTKPPNKGTITVFNMSEEVSNYLAANQSNNIVILLKAGYEDTSLETIFKGTLSAFEEDFSTETKKTKLMVSDGGVNLREGNTLRSWPTGTPVDTIVETLLDDIGLPKAQGGIAKLGASVKAEAPVYMTGSIFAGIRRLAEEHKMVFSIQDGSAYWMPPEARSEVVAYSLNEFSGMIGSPQPINKSGAAKQGDVKNKQTSLRVTCTLNGAIKPESTIYVKSINYDTALKVTKVTHTGAFEGSSWNTVIEGDIVDAIVLPASQFGGNR